MPFLVNTHSLLRIGAVVSLGLASTALLGAERLAQIELRIGKHKVVAETAATEPARTLGLMHRKQPLANDHGMLFVFTESGFHSMWMQNTYIPLSVAFLDSSGVILNIADMTPLTTTAHTAAGFAKFALEMNQGWFATRGIGPGVKVEGLQVAPEPQ
jgi:uncharacterized membrane protein (UPF0127 family)